MPLLFALLTEPLMSFLNIGGEDGFIRGVSWEREALDQLIYELFVDNIGLFLRLEESNFSATHNMIQVYEQVLRAKLNVEKSITIQLNDLDIPNWISKTGCWIAKLGEVFSYLGNPIGVRDSTNDEVEFLL